MKVDKEIIICLNKQLTYELTAINQTFLHAKMYKNWGLFGIAKREYKASIDEMKQSDKLTERIFFLEGLPNLQQLEKLRIGEQLKECISCDLELEKVCCDHLVQSILLCETFSDYVSRDLLKRILEETEQRIDDLEVELNLFETLGAANFIQNQLVK